MVMGQQRFALTVCGSVTVCKIALEERTRRSATMPLWLRTACSPACAGAGAFLDALASLDFKLSVSG